MLHRCQENSSALFYAIVGQNLELVTYLVDEINLDVNATNDLGNYKLHKVVISLTFNTTCNRGDAVYFCMPDGKRIGRNSAAGELQRELLMQMQVRSIGHPPRSL